MKKIFNSLLIIVFALLLIEPGLRAQENRTVTTKIADMLAQMPANNLQQRNKLMEELISLGDEGFQKLAGQMTPSGKGDNTAVVFAINGLARYACQNTKEDKRAFAERNFIQAMDKTPDAETKAFFMRQLQLVGKEDAVKAVAPYLTNSELCEPATFLLTSVGTESAKNELFRALTKAQSNQLITITKALGELRYKPANGQILKTITSDNQNLKKVSLAAVAAIAAPESYQPLLEAARKTGFVYEPSNATQAFATYAQRLGESGEMKLLSAACEEMMKLSQPTQLHTNASALAIYNKYFEKEAQPKLLKVFDNNDKAFRFAVLNLVEKSQLAPTKQWIAKANKAQPEPKAEIITMLGKKGDLSASDFIKKQFADKSAEVSEAAITAYAKLKGKDAVPDLIVLLKSGVQPSFTATTLMSLMDEKSLDPLVTILESSPENSKAAVIGIVGAKSGKRFFDQVYNYTGSANPEIKSAAFAAMKNISTAKDIDRLLKLLFATDDVVKIKNIQDALVNAASDLKGEDSQTAPLLAQLPNAPKKGRILEILPRLGGKQALKAVTGYTSSSNKEESDAAFNALINWKDETASASLYEICKNSNGERQSSALKGFVRQIRNSALPEDQKLLQYRKMIPLATDNKDRSLIIRSMGQVRTFLSLVATASFLDDAGLSSDAAQAVMEIALPAEGQKGLSGIVVRDALNKAMTKLTGSESDYEKARVVKYLGEMTYEDGLVPMFNGKDLSGWHGLVGNPITRKKMDAKEFAKKQAEADLKLQNNWSVKDGCITFNGEGDNLCSVKQYGDFEMVVDWRITKKGDSGIYLRGSPQVQIWDTSRVEVGAQVGSGGLYNNQKNPAKPLKVADNPVGEWNTFRIKMIGDKVTVFLNGELVVDNVTLENYWDRTIPIFPKEAIELQAHGTDLAFRDIYVRELNNNQFTVSDEETKEGFKPLFNGNNFEGWTGNTVDYHVENGEIVLHIDNGPSHGNLFTKDEYSDFDYRFEFQLTPAANNGLGIRAPLEGDAAYVGMELQILDNEDPVYATLAPYQYHGSVYGVIPAKRGYLKPTGQWNYEEVIAKGPKIKVILNGTVILDGDIKEASKNGTADHKEHPGLLREKGHIGFLGHGSVVKFRNIRLKDLSKK
ncbi:MAG TPA: family 16 glycoside hydrolase [Prolixibacteraceae bacterium]